MKLFDVYPINDITIVKAQGSTLWDDKGQQYLDMYGGHAVISIGHSNPHYIKTIETQLENIGFYSNSIKIPAQQRLADLLGELSGKNDYQLFLCNSGAEANENAMKLASFHTNRKLVVAFSASFHGRTSLAVAATDNPNILAPINQTDNIVFLPFNDTDALNDLFKKRGAEIAAVICEAIQGVGGIQIATNDFLQTIRTLCDKHGSVMIADEVQCGCGRTGKYFATDHASIQADIYSMAKGIGNGFPIGAIMIAPHIKPKYGMLGTTFGGNHLAVAAAIAVTEEIISTSLMQNALNTGDYIMKNLNKLSKVTDVRGKGLMIGIEFPFDTTDLRKRLIFEKHLFVGSASNKNLIRLLPSLTITKQQCDQTVQAIQEMI